MRSRLAPLAGLAVALCAGACATPSRTAGAPGSAVIVWEPAREADAGRARDVLAGLGWTADVAPSGPARRTRSSLAVYAQRRRPGHGAFLAGALEPAVGRVEVLPFLADGPGRHDAVLWLADAPGLR